MTTPEFRYLQPIALSFSDRHKSFNLVLIGLVFCGSMAPSGDEGISGYEIAGMALSLLGIIIYLFISISRSKYIPWGILTFALAVAWTTLSVFHQGLQFYARNVAGLVFFVGCLLLGSQVSVDQRGYVCVLLTALTILGLFRDAIADIAGLNIGTAIVESAWIPSSRAPAVSRSSYPLILAALTAPYLYMRKPKFFLLGLCCLLLSFGTAVIIGAGRGATILLFLCLLLATRTKVQFITVIVAIALLGLGLGLALWHAGNKVFTDNPYAGRILCKFADLGTAITTDSITNRTSQMRYALSLIRKGDLINVMVGFSLDRIYNEEGSLIHNAYLDATLRYGMPCAGFYAVFWVASVAFAAKKLITVHKEPLWVSKAAVLVITIFVSSLVGSVPGWRNVIIPATVFGMFWAHCTSKVQSSNSNLSRVLNHPYRRHNR